MSKKTFAVLQAVNELNPAGYAVTLLRRACEILGTNWFGMERLSTGGLYIRLQKLERLGLIQFYWSAEAPNPVRGNRRKGCYKITTSGRQLAESPLYEPGVMIAQLRKGRVSLTITYPDDDLAELGYQSLIATVRNLTGRELTIILPGQIDHPHPNDDSAVLPDSTG
jgi:DNA-binding PadR family transcriptional regulator